ncbi:putative vinexin isoform X11 [Apostichopus japonicus]|uniref:Putative vinexin isoform X11 n=1 Tax=Stichopus japonicus TaxID=307972 RepID=A0A2G8KBU3_STIJA|nr:putative vinexin isoform X11 [Apostichopus japonicus]
MNNISNKGVWQPGQTPEQDDEYNGHDNFQDLQPVWAPSSSQPAKKEFRVKNLHLPSNSHPVQQAPPSPVRKQPPSAVIQRQHQPPVHTAVHHPATPQPTPSSPSRVPATRRTPSPGPPQTPPRAPSRRQPPKKPNVTVITDPAQLPTGALYQKITIDGDKIHTDTYYPMEDKPKHETTNLNDETKQRIVQKAPTYEGIGPRDQESGMPLGLRQHVKEDNRHDWYKEMYKSIHKQDRDEVTSNPFDSQPSKPPADNPVVSTPVNRYRQQPRSIVDYEPGKSSLVGTERAPMEAQTVRQDYAAPPPQSHRSGYGSDDESRRAKQNLPVNQYPDKSNQGLGASNISGKDKNYNYKNPPHTLDKASVQKIIDEEKKKRALADREIQDSRRHSDYTSTKGPIITDDRFKDILADAKPIIDNTSKKETRACAIALYSFSAQSPKELSFKKGDTLYLTKEIDRNWYRENSREDGYFPVVENVVTSIDEARKNQLALPSKEGKAKAKFKFKGETQNELSFSKHDYIDLIRRVDGNWWEGRLGPRTGIFPDSYIEVLKHPEGVCPICTVTHWKLPWAHFTLIERKPLPYERPYLTCWYPRGTALTLIKNGSSPTRRSMNQQPARGQPMSPGRVPDERITQTNAAPVQSQPMYQQKQQQQQPPRTQQYNPGVSQHPVSQSQHQQRAPSPHHGTAQTYTIDRQSPTPITRQSQDQYQAMYNYVPQNDDELELRDGDMVVVLEKCDDGWFVGTSLRTGMFGTFPGNYVTKALSVAGVKSLYEAVKMADSGRKRDVL